MELEQIEGRFRAAAGELGLGVRWGKEILVTVPAPEYPEDALLEAYGDYSETEAAESCPRPMDRLSGFTAFLRDSLLEKLLEGCPDLPEGTERELRRRVRFAWEGDILLRRIRVDIGVDTGDSNWDYTLNTLSTSSRRRLAQGLRDEASILWLAKQQGYRRGELIYALAGERDKVASPLLCSAAEEVEDEVSGMNQLIFLVSMTVEELLVLCSLLRWGRDTGSWPGYLVLDPNTVCGLGDTYNGGLSRMGLRLEKPVKLPVKHIAWARPDYTEWPVYTSLVRGAYRYAIDEVLRNREAWGPGRVLHWCLPKKFRRSLEDWGLDPAFLRRAAVDKELSEGVS